MDIWKHIPTHTEMHLNQHSIKISVMKLNTFRGRTPIAHKVGLYSRKSFIYKYKTSLNDAWFH